MSAVGNAESDIAGVAVERGSARAVFVTEPEQAATFDRVFEALESRFLLATWTPSPLRIAGVVA